MAIQNLKQKEQMIEKHEKPVGTWFSVGVVGLAIAATYILLFGLYMARV
jgi:hypothetical protein